MFQQGDDILAIVELARVEKNSLEIQAKDNTIRIAGRKAISYPEGMSVHRRERSGGDFDRTLSIPVRIDADAIKVEYRDGVLDFIFPARSRISPGPSR